MRAGACDACVLNRNCCGSCWCCPWPRVDAAMKWAANALRAGDSKEFVATVLEVKVEKALVS